MGTSRPTGSFRLLYTRRAVKDIEGLDAVTKRSLGRKLGEIVASPDAMRHAKALTSPELGSHRFRIGDYRVIFDLTGNDIVVLRVGHRRDIYRR